MSRAKTRLNVNIAPAEDESLGGYQERKGLTRTAAVERAARLLLFVDDVQERGAEIVVTEPDGRSRHVQFMV